MYMKARQTNQCMQDMIWPPWRHEAAQSRRRCSSHIHARSPTHLPKTEHRKTHARAVTWPSNRPRALVGIWSQTNGQNSDRTLTHIMRPPVHTEQLHITNYHLCWSVSQRNGKNALRTIWAAGTRRKIPRHNTRQVQSQCCSLFQAETRTDQQHGPDCSPNPLLHTKGLTSANGCGAQTFMKAKWFQQHPTRLMYFAIWKCDRYWRD